MAPFALNAEVANTLPSWGSRESIFSASRLAKRYLGRIKMSPGWLLRQLCAESIRTSLGGYSLADTNADGTQVQMDLEARRFDATRVRESVRGRWAI